MTPDVATILALIPAYEEGPRIGAVVAATARHLPVVVIDDGSADDTAVAAEAAGATVLRQVPNAGKGAALRRGFQHALDAGADAVVTLDADGQHDPAEVPELIAALDESDIAIGARFAGKGEYATRGPRRWAMLVLSRVISGISRTKLTDTTSGFKANGPRAIALFAQHYPAEYLGDTVEALVIAARAGLRIRQVPVAMRPRQGGAPSHHPVKAAVYLVRAFVALGFALLRPRVIIPETGGSR